MKFSYFFNTEKTHLLNFIFLAEEVKTLNDGSIETTFTASIEEVENNYVKRKESVKRTFSFLASEGSTDKHDIDFIRTRYADQNKWIFEVKNNKNPLNQNVVVGLITDTANKNPIGLDIIQDATYKADLKANNLSQLEQSYVPPVLTQTIVNTTFSSSGYPAGFVSSTAAFNPTYQLYQIKDFKQTFLNPIPVGAGFEIKFNLAPVSVATQNGPELMELIIPRVGVFKLLTGGIEYLKSGDESGNAVRSFFTDAITPVQFFNQGMQSMSEVLITADGIGNITLKYAGLEVTGTYNSSHFISEVEFKSKPLAHAPDLIVNYNDPSKWIEFLLDNLSIVYKK